MGYFTFTDCQNRGKSIGYDKAFVVCPDNTIIEEPYYEGYGIFKGKDIYELVVDWNRHCLASIFEKMEKRYPEGFWGNYLKIVALDAMIDDDCALTTAKLTTSGWPDYCCGNYLDWKRTLGITISCMYQNNASLPYPIKISATRPTKSYEELSPSGETQ